jgi:hypothetical protein
VAADDRSIFTPGQNRLDEAELAQAALQSVEFLLSDPAWVGRVGAEEVDGDLLDGGGEGRRRGHADLTRAAASHSSRPSIVMR